MRRATVIATLLGALLLAAITWISAQEAGAPKERSPLDLPHGSKGSGEEAAPGDVVSFYGGDFEGDAFFWCLDHSGSMGWAGEIEILKQEMQRSISQLSSRSEFGLIAIADEVTLWREKPETATDSAKESAIAFVTELEAHGGACLTDGLSLALGLAAKSSAKNKAIVLVGDGGPACGDETAESALKAIAEANVDRVPIHAVYLSASEGGVDFYRRLAKESGGTLMLVPVNR